MTAYAALYWTRPVKWAGFTTLPTDPDEAAKLSRTILYQKELVRRWARDEKPPIMLAAETAYIDEQSDRSSPGIGDAIAALRKRCGPGPAVLVYVDFERDGLARKNRYLLSLPAELGFDEVRPLWPDEVMINGKRFNPREHFQAWREQDEDGKAALRRHVNAGLATAFVQVPEGSGRYRAMADHLNSRGIRTLRGVPWTEDNVRMALAKTWTTMVRRDGRPQAVRVRADTAERARDMLEATYGPDAILDWPEATKEAGSAQN